MGPHFEFELSAYVDDALDAGERARVAAHLTACRLCASRARELRATAGLLRALPDPRPSRSLVPRFSRTPAWFAPARLLSGLASGAFALLFVAAALGSIAGSGGATTAAAPAVAPNAAAPGLGGRSVPGPTERTDGAGSASEPASPSASSFSVTQRASPAAVALPAERVPTATERARTAPAPLVWLGLALASGAVAAALHVRMRAR